jgi:ankyrin repeat protein
MRAQRSTSLRGEAALGISLLLLAATALWVSTPARAADAPTAQAAREDDLAALRALIGGGADVNVAARDGSTALLWAAYHSHADMVEALIAAGAKTDVPNKYGVTPLLQASRTGDAAVIAALLDGGADLALTHPDGETPLMAAARAGRVDAVRLLLERGADPNTADSFQQQTALMWAAVEGHAEVIDVLLTAGANPNLQARISTLTERKNADYPSGGFTALMWAARNGHDGIVRRLAEAGADLSMTNGDGATAAMLAIVNDRFDLAAMLIELGADANDGSLYYAMEMRDATTDWYARDGSKLRADHPNDNTALDLIALLLDNGADPNKTFTGQMHSSSMCCDTRANSTPLYRAAVAADVEALKLLIEHDADLEWSPTSVEGGGPGANINVGRTPLMAALRGGRGVPISAGPGYSREGPPPFREPSNREPAAAVALLVAAGANVDAVDPKGATALHQAVELRKIGLIKALTGGGADLLARNADGLTAMDLAERLQPIEPNANPFGPPRDLDGASPEEVVAVLREAMQAAGVPVETHAAVND